MTTLSFVLIPMLYLKNDAISMITSLEESSAHTHQLGPLQMKEFPLKNNKVAINIMMVQILNIR
jgi:hypothetical protein